MDRNKSEPSIFHEIWSEDRQVISSKFPKSFRGAGDFVVLGDFLKSEKTSKNHEKVMKHHLHP